MAGWAFIYILEQGVLYSVPHITGVVYSVSKPRNPRLHFRSNLRTELVRLHFHLMKLV